VMEGFLNILTVAADLLYADGWTDRQTERHADMSEPVVAVRCFAELPDRAAVLSAF
jgi:hypothetical protein